MMTLSFSIRVLAVVLSLVDAGRVKASKASYHHNHNNSYAAWMDQSLPLAHSVHPLGQHRRHRSRGGETDDVAATTVASALQQQQQQQQQQQRTLGAGKGAGGSDSPAATLQVGAELAPLFPGYGTHFAYVYVGTPAQRQSVIIDTGSHYTAFPCTGCAQCGSHTDPYWDIKNSSTAVVPKCSGQQCAISQSYTEGSSWHAYKVVDKLWVGGADKGLLPGAGAYSMDFLFGCQTSETGLFRTQLADGIMGMSAADDTLPSQLFQQHITASKVFALCFRVGGGILTLGGVDQRIHSKKTVSYVKMDTKSNGWYGVTVKSVTLISPSTSLSAAAAASAGLAVVLSGADIESAFSRSKGTIVDSGTTDTYLPATISAQFSAAFKEIAGTSFFTGNSKLTEKQLTKLPTILFSLESTTNGSTVEVAMPFTSYVDSVGDGKYTLRVFLTEKDGGAVLGANFMTGYNTIFDVDEGRMGFAKSTCNYEEYSEPLTRAPSAFPTSYPGENKANEEQPCVSEMVGYTECSARCDVNESAYRSEGVQEYVDKCDVYGGKSEVRPCFENCSFFKIVRGDPQCPDKAWTECTHGCVMSRQAVPLTDAMLTRGKCNYHVQTATCYSHQCPIEDGDYLIYVDMRVRLEPWRWSYVYTEAFYTAMTNLFKLRPNHVELLNDAGNEYTFGTKLHFQMRLRKKDFTGLHALHNAAQQIALDCQEASFPRDLINALSAAVKDRDGSSINRFGWLFEQDIDVLNAIAMPIGDQDREYMVESDEEWVDAGVWGTGLNMVNLILIGIILGCVVTLLVMLYLYNKLRQENALFEKDKSVLARGGHKLQRLWKDFQSSEKFKAMKRAKDEAVALVTGNNPDAPSHADFVRVQQEMEMEMADRGHFDDEMDDDDLDGVRA